MPRRFNGLKAGVAVGSAIALVGILIGVAVASIPSSTGVISGCYSTKTGALRVIDYPTKRCVSGERLIRWDKARTATPAPPPLTAVDGSPCTLLDGSSATLHVEVTRDGTVSLKCWPMLRITSAITASRILITSETAPQADRTCDNTRACSTAFPPGTSDVHLVVYAATPFAYTCPGLARTTSFFDLARSVNMGECVDISMPANRTIAVTAP